MTGFDSYNLCLTGEIGRTLATPSGGLNEHIRCLNDDDIEDINKMKLRTIHFAWDNPNDDLEGKFRTFAQRFRRASNIGMVYCLTNFENVSLKEHIERALTRIYKLSEMGYDPYLMIYNKPNAPVEIKDLQRWCNNKIIFKTVPRFEDYKPTREMN